MSAEQKTKRDWSVVEQIAVENIEHVFEQLDIDYENMYTYLTCACPIHGGENKTGFSFSLELRTWKCWSTGNECGDKYPSNIIGLVMGTRNVRFPAAIAWLCEILSIDENNIPTFDKEEVDQKKFTKKAAKKKVVPKRTYDKDCLKRLVAHDYFVDRGYKEKTLEQFQCGFAVKGSMAKRIVFPIIDLNDDIVGFAGRIVYDYCKACGEYHEGKCGENFSTRRKWKNSRFLPASEIIYNLNRAKHHLTTSNQEIVLVEGIPDIMRLYQIGVKNAICLLGASISQTQIRKLLSIGYVSKIHVLTDSDVAGMNFKNKHSKYDDEDFESLSRYFNVGKLSVEGAKDIGDLSDQEALAFCKDSGIIR